VACVAVFFQQAAAALSAVPPFELPPPCLPQRHVRASVVPLRFHAGVPSPSSALQRQHRCYRVVEGNV